MSKAQFTPVYLALLHVDGLTPLDVILHGLLRRFQMMGECRPSIARLAAETGMDARDVRRKVSKLEALKLVNRVLRPGRPTLYEVPDHPLMFAPGGPGQDDPGEQSPRGEIPEGVRGEIPEGVRGEIPEGVRGEIPEGVRGEIPLQIEIEEKIEEKIEDTQRARPRSVASVRPRDVQPESSALDARERRLAIAETAIRVGFATRFEQAEKGLWTRAGGPEVETLALWAVSVPGELVDVVARTLDGFFADAWAKTHHYPIGALAKNPQRYLEPRSMPRAVDPTARLHQLDREYVTWLGRRDDARRAADPVLEADAEKRLGAIRAEIRQLKAGDQPQRAQRSRPLGDASAPVGDIVSTTLRELRAAPRGAVAFDGDESAAVQLGRQGTA